MPVRVKFNVKFCENKNTRRVIKEFIYYARKNLFATAFRFSHIFKITFCPFKIHPKYLIPKILPSVCHAHALFVSETILPNITSYDKWTAKRYVLLTIFMRLLLLLIHFMERNVFQ